MAQVLTTSVVRQIGSLFEGGTVAGLTDRQLLDRFNARRDHTAEAAFAALVAHHGPMVLGVCRQLLGDHQHAEDAFQAVFLVLARRARSVRDPDLLGNWLYGVALRTARKARRRLERRHKIEEDRAVMCPEASATVPADRSTIDREQAEALHDEIDRLPGSFRVPVVLCYFEGLSLDEAARRLRCPAGTVHSRLARARDRLRRGLTRRGVVLPAATLAAVLESRPASACISSPLCEISTRAAWNFAAGQAAAPAAVALAKEVLKSMLIHKLKLTAFTLLCLGTVAAGAGFVGQAPMRQAGKPDLRQITAKPDDPAPRPEPGRMIVVGRVLDPQGKPVPNATVMVCASLKGPGGGDRHEMGPSSIGEARSDGSGRFRLDAIRTSSSIHQGACAVAVAPGYGAGWVELDIDADHPTAEITLHPEQVIQGRLFDLQGQPVQGVSVLVAAMGRLLPNPEGDPDDEDIDGPALLLENHAKSLPAWPRPASTDVEGRFTVRGAGQGLRVFLVIDDPRFNRQLIKVDTDNTPSSKPVIVAVQPARIIVGRVQAADTGKPIANAHVATNGGDVVETGADGRFRARVESSDRQIIMVNGPQGQPYLSVRTKEFEWPKGAIEHRVDVVLPRGIAIRGKVTEEGSGKPIAGTTLGYLSRSAQDGQFDWSVGQAWSGPDGSFQLAVPPQSHHLIVRGPSEDYVRQEIGERMILEGHPGGRRMYAHAFIPLKSGGETRELAVVLRRSMTVKGQVIGPDGQPVQDARMVSRVFLMWSGGPWSSGQGYLGDVRNGRFELHGLATDSEIPVYFLEPKRKLGATVNLSGKSGSGGPITVRLASCGTARARLVNSAGKPLAGYRDLHLIWMVVTPGRSWSTRDKADEGRLAVEQDFLGRIDPINYPYPDGSVSDAQGRVAFPALIPGATYQIQDHSGEGGHHLRKTFTVKPGETLNLGDIRIEKPEA